MVININKKIMIFFFIILVVLGIYFLFSKNITHLINEKTVILPNVTLVPTTNVSTGGSGEMLKEVLKERPEYGIESKLREQVPIKQDGFEITFNYSANMFLVRMSEPFSQNETRFQEWAKQQGLTDLSKFQITR